MISNTNLPYIFGILFLFFFGILFLKAQWYGYKSVNNKFYSLVCTELFPSFLLFFHLRFDVEKECAKLDEDKERTVINNKSHLSKIETRLDTAGNGGKIGMI